MKRDEVVEILRAAIARGMGWRQQKDAEGMLGNDGKEVSLWMAENLSRMIEMLYLTDVIDSAEYLALIANRKERRSSHECDLTVATDERATLSSIFNISQEG